MYGTIARFEPRPGREQRLLELMEEWNRERAPKVKGAVAAYLYKLDRGGWMMAAVFDSKENYMANAADPEQDAWYRKWRAELQADPEWNDGEVFQA